MHKIPIILEDYLNYMETIKGTSSSTIKEYYYDLRIFFRFIKQRYKLITKDMPFDSIDISDINLEQVNRINLQDLHSFISYLDKERDNNNYSKSRKVASLKSFFDYLHIKVGLIENSPADGLEFPKVDSRQPVYLTLSECQRLLNIVLENKNELFRKRDYAIIILFLNCGLRLSELASIDIPKIKKDTLAVVGKGNKERTIYLNNACISAIQDYLTIRPKATRDVNALFLSMRKNRMSNRAIQHMIDRYLKKAGFDTDVYSTHKLRHTAATLLYKYGNVDIRALQEILGHENVSTTQIYTHIDDQRLRDAVNSNPLANAMPDLSLTQADE